MDEQKVINEAMRVLPAEIKKNLEETYKSRSDKLISYLTSPDVDDTSRKQILVSVINTYNQKLQDLNNAINTISNIYKKRELANVGILGIQPTFSYKNPDPEDFISKKEKYGEEGAFNIVAEFVKEIMDGNDDLKKYIPEKLSEPNTWEDSFKYWQIYAVLVGQLLNRSVSLDIIESVNGLRKYRTVPFKPIQQPKQDGKKKQQKKSGKKSGKKFGGFDKGRRNDRRDDRGRGNNRRDNRGKGDQKKEQGRVDMEKVMKNIYAVIDGRNLSLWKHSEDKLKDAFKKVVDDMNIEFTDDGKPMEAKDPLTGLTYTTEELDKIVPKNDSEKIKTIKNNIWNNVFIKITNTDKDTILSKISGISKDYLKYLHTDKSIEEAVGGSIWKGTKLRTDDDAKKKIFNAFLKINELKEDIMKNHIKDNYSLNAINFLFQLRENKEEFKKIRENLLITLIGYYYQSKQIINKFINTLQDRFRITNEDLKKSISNKQVINKSRDRNVISTDQREKIIKLFGDEEKRILNKVDTMISKLPLRSRERQEMVEKRDIILNLLIDKRRNQFKKLEEKKKQNKKPFDKKHSNKKPFNKKPFNKKPFNKKQNNNLNNNANNNTNVNANNNTNNDNED